MPLEQVHPDPNNVRIGLPSGAMLEALRESLRTALERGEEFDEPIVVYPLRNDVYRIKSGHRRYAAARGVVEQLHFHVVKPPETEAERIEGQLDDNLNHETLSDIEVGTALLKLQQTGNYSLGQLTERLRQRGIPTQHSSKTWVAQKIELVKKLTSEVQHMVHSGLCRPQSPSSCGTSQ
ncbi:MAG: ParB/RepB/Spo0J family partition protein [Chloroflexota bacterium]